MTKNEEAVMPKMTREEIESKIEEAKRQVPVGSRWVHYKHPDKDHVYIVTDGEKVIVHYKPFYYEVAKVEFSRTLEEWLEMVSSPSGSVPRFKRYTEPL